LKIQTFQIIVDSVSSKGLSTKNST